MMNQNETIKFAWQIDGESSLELYYIHVELIIH